MVGRSAEKQNAASLCGADYYFDSSSVDLQREIRKVTDGRGVDVVVTACSSPVALKQALGIIAKKGAVNIFGGLPRDESILDIDCNMIHYKEFMITGSSDSAPGHVAEALKLIETGRIEMEKYISHRYELKDVNLAMDVVRKGPRCKVLIIP
jgi:L-iditol 2-dehydrogenase